MRTDESNVALEDIAKTVGVAVSTVSRALRDLPGIHPATRKRIVQEAEARGYVIRSKKTPESKAEAQHVLVLPVDDDIHPGYQVGLSRASVELNIALHLHYSMRADCHALLEEGTQPPALRDSMINGAVLVYRWPEEVVAEISRRLPTVSIVHHYPKAPVDVVGIDHFSGMYLLTEHLLALGHGKIGYFGLCPFVSWARTRYTAMGEALLAQGTAQTLGPAIELDLNRPLQEQIDHKADEVAAHIRQGVRAWCCAEDSIGYALCNALLARGLKIPEDAALTGFHRHPHTSYGNLPPLTSIDIDSQLLGFTALQRLAYRLANPKESSRTLLLRGSFFQGATTPIS